jgi:phosphoribosylformylglycinamidine (FGAM) synthase-like amidotransferase family enzyme
MTMNEEYQQAVERYRDAKAALEEAKADPNVSFEEVERLRDELRNALYYL